MGNNTEGNLNPELIKSGRSTDDYVFLLSIKEAEKIDKSMLKFDTVWWLRSPGYLQDRAADVFLDGNVSYPGCPFLHSLHAVRPAMNLKIPDITD